MIRLGCYILAAVVGLGACTPRYEMTAPEAFKRFDQRGGYKAITADGVMLKAREVKNYPEGDLPFWTDALQRHLLARGYMQKGKTECFKTQKGLDGCTLVFLLPHGAEDWAFAQTVFVQGKRIVLVESAGPFDRFAKIEPALATAMRSFDPGE